MIFYGSKSTHLHSEQASGIKCDHCNQQTQHTFSIYGKYAYIYWIPIFPLGQKGVSECNHCKATLAPKEMNDQLKFAYQNTKANAKTPIWYWSGAAIIALFIIYGVFSSQQHKNDVANYINEPLAGDVIEFKDDNYYSTVKISTITPDSIFLIDNDFQIDKQGKTNKIDKEKNYTTDPYSISTDRFKELFEEKIFLDIKRK